MSNNQNAYNSNCQQFCYNFTTASRCNESNVTTALTARGWRARELLEEAERAGVPQLPRVTLRPALPSTPPRGLRSTESPPPPPGGSTPAPGQVKVSTKLRRTQYLEKRLFLPGPSPCSVLLVLSQKRIYEDTPISG